ncbi:MAG TPA: DUF5698 domain-containing protein [Planctomycetota bacterium]|nr:DUF5698 domain-containing protein [Planctomycetota bacterium]
MFGNRFLYSLLLILLLCFWFFAYKTGGNTADLSRQSPLLGALMIFVLRLSDMTLDTMRLIFTMRGHKWLAGLVGFMQAAIVVVAIAQVVKNVNNVWNIIGYAGGYAAGIIVGMTLEERMALGFSHLQIISSGKGAAIAEALRVAGHAVTVLTGMGRDGTVNIVHCTVRRSDASVVKSIAEEADPKAFVTGEEVRPLARGYFRG